MMDPAPSAHTTTALEQCLDSLTTALHANIQPGAGLYDPVDETPTPGDHYGQTAAALALALQEGPDSGFWRHPLEAWEALPAHQTGHAPFNRFLLNLLAEHLEQSGAPTSEALHIRHLARRCKLSRRYPSNNWTLLARLCELQEARGNARTRAHARLRGLLDRWITPYGAFVDYPARPGTPARGATPTAYHHKALFVAVMASEYSEPEVWEPLVKPFLQWSMQSWDGHGHVGGLGRSSHALFGDACLVASLILLGAAHPSAQSTAAGQMLQGILERWIVQTRPNGFIALNPADAVNPGTGCDAYMHLSVYNAWAAALVAWARARASQAGRRHPGFDLQALSPSASPHDASIAEQFRVGDPDATFALVSSRGQPPQGFSRSEAELRYAGGIPLHLAWKGRTLCPAPGRVPRSALEGCPALAGWTPIFQAGGALFALTDFDHCEHELRDRTVRISLSGQPRALLRAPATGLKERAMAALDWRLLNSALGHGAALNRPRLHDITCHILLTIHLDQPRVEQRLTLEHTGDRPVRYLNPGGHAVTSAPLAECSFQHLATSGAAAARAEEWQEAAIPSAIPDATGRCQKPMQLPSGGHSTECVIVWEFGPDRRHDTTGE
ncbi:MULTISPECIES: hypothetical protein [unclassified Thioalkalivibrio]|uniref:hypothetical protein n=1 Tax=unclassified Thioalkalivibrio TaxID=2621013 RepID=UPI0003A1408B|nr:MULTISPECIES: hypothetical protein [unclassified Thioalkalivibrio]